MHKAASDEQPAIWTNEQHDTLLKLGSRTADDLGTCLGGLGEPSKYEKDNANHFKWEWTVRLSGQALTTYTIEWLVRIPWAGKALIGKARKAAAPMAVIILQPAE